MRKEGSDRRPEARFGQYMVVTGECCLPLSPGLHFRRFRVGALVWVWIVCRAYRVNRVMVK